jgi:hypothetical protein
VKELILAAYVVSALVFLYLAVRSRSLLLVAYTAAIPWFGLQADIGLTISIDRFAAFLLLGLALMVVPRSLSKTCGLLLLFMVLDTFVLSQFLPEAASTFVALRGKYRWIFQIVIWSALIAPVAIFNVSSRELALKTYRALVWSALILAGFGIAQFVVYRATGVDLFPIAVTASEEQFRTGIIQGDSFLGGAQSLRVSSLGGEPKHLALSLVVCLTALLANQLSGGPLRFSRRFLFVAGGVLLGTLVLTFSTQGFTLLVVNAAIVFALSRVLLPKGSTSRSLKLLAVVGAVGAVIVATPGVVDLVEHRTVDRFREGGALEETNEIVISWLHDHPEHAVLGVGLGNVHMYAGDYIPDELRYYLVGNVFVAKAGLLRLVSEIGVVGLAIFLLTFLKPLRSLWPAAKVDDRGATFQIMMAVSGVFDFMLTLDGPIYVFLIMGLSYAMRPSPPVMSPALAEAEVAQSSAG